MDPATFMIGMGAAIAQDQEVQGWCQAMFGKALTVYVGVDLNNPPEESEYPLCALFDASPKWGESGPPVITLDLAVALVDEELKVDGNLKIFAGLPKVAELKSLVEGAILRSGLAVAVDFIASDGLLPMAPTFFGFSMAECQLIKSSRQAVRR
ncbi:MAG: hypothetical protein WC869_17060 [Phycisphaerae bacterium]|jgi:hypothetical protein